MYLISGLLIFLIIIYIGWHISAPAYKGPESDHFKNGKFINPGGVKSKGFADAFRWMLSRKKGEWNMDGYDISIGEKPLSESDELLITFVNHSTFLIQWNQLNILTDPVWSYRVSPFSFAGPHRMRPPGLNFEDLPDIDIVLLSHNHYDHLDITTVLKIESNYNPVFVVPLGVKAYLQKKGITNVVELDWWQQTNPGLLIKATPAQHFSGRGMFDRDRTLWCGYVICHENKKLYYVGDSGYGSFFKEIGKKEGPMDVSLIPIGAFKPRWFMSPIHVDPQQAIQIHRDVKSKKSIAMHFGTFALADEGHGVAEEELILELARLKVPQNKFIIPTEGSAIRDFSADV